MSANPLGQNEFNFSDEDEFSQSNLKAQSTDSINLMEQQKRILRGVLNLTSWENQKGQVPEGDTFADDDHDAYDESQKMVVGANGQMVDKSLFTFKILVYDNLVQSLIAPIFKVGNLRDCNVVLHCNINSKREACPGLPVVYLVEPTEDNFRLIAQDCQRSLYDYIFINFVREVKEHDLDKLAYEIAKTNQAHKVCRVAYEHLGSYQVINRDFFTFFGQAANFAQLHKGLNEEAIVDNIASSMFEMFCSLGLAPYVKVSDQDEAVNKKVQQRLLALFQGCDAERKASFSKKNRPLLMVFNRKADVQGMLYHSWKYLALIQDIFGITNNQFQCNDGSSNQVFELDFGIK